MTIPTRILKFPLAKYINEPRARERATATIYSRVCKIAGARLAKLVVRKSYLGPSALLRHLHRNDLYITAIIAIKKLVRAAFPRDCKERGRMLERCRLSY